MGSGHLGSGLASNVPHRHGKRLGNPNLYPALQEWWFWEVIILAAGWLPNGTVAIGVVGIAVQFSTFAYMCSYALSTATSTCVANALGAGQAQRAQRLTRWADAGCTVWVHCAGWLEPPSFLHPWS